jgi:hypothetical protein
MIPSSDEVSGVLDPDPNSMGSQGLDPDSQSGSESRRAKMTDKNRKKITNFSF